MLPPVLAPALASNEKLMTPRKLSPKTSQKRVRNILDYTYHTFSETWKLPISSNLYIPTPLQLAKTTAHLHLVPLVLEPQSNSVRNSFFFPQGTQSRSFRRSLLRFNYKVIKCRSGPLLRTAKFGRTHMTYGRKLSIQSVKGVTSRGVRRGVGTSIMSICSKVRCIL